MKNILSNIFYASLCIPMVLLFLIDTLRIIGHIITFLAWVAGLVISNIAGVLVVSAIAFIAYQSYRNATSVS